ncbi:hypothetical protein JZ751_015661 [Albula glossodonta]|uniref:NXPE C-terminal domain-containing protein n=1 Tax=Albula glossodonta TaxID=121402 RepID=A0A8T2NR04_9TELE|nr:hypothetical protein JZ751_015661 [Albula glossodonta]
MEEGADKLFYMLFMFAYIFETDSHDHTNVVSEVTPTQPSEKTTTQQNVAPTKDALISSTERTSLLAGLEWPAPNKIVSSVNESTDATKCSYEVINLQENYTIGSFVNVLVVARDANGLAKTHGGDFFQAKLYNSQLKASTFGFVIDHNNGTYTVQFSLLWSGPAHVSILLVHSSEAVQVLRKQRDQDPDKVIFYGYFKDGTITEQVVCNALQSPWLVGDSKSCCCKYRDPVTGESWFCRRPSSLPCHAFSHHSMGRYQANLSSLESSLLNEKREKVVLGKDPVINVLPQETVKRENRRCQPGLDTPVPAGFYFQDRWTSMVCKSQAFSTAMLISDCLRDKQVHMMGDSTLRQWFEYLVETVPTLKRLNLYTSALSGPLEAVNLQNNYVIRWRAHGIPFRTTKTPVADLHYIARQTDDLAGGRHIVIVITIWAHFTTYPVDIYMRRVATIRRSILSLLQRAPDTLVLIKSANTGFKDVYGSDWLSWQLDLILRTMFRSLPVTFIDVWQMTSCHYSPDNIHPPKEVVRNEVDLFLSFVCPQ